MTSREKRIGSEFERKVADYLQENGFPEADRRYGAGVQQDKGDIVGVPGFTLECKNQKKIDLASFIDEALVEQGHAKTKYGVAVVKRRMRSIKDSYVVMTLEQWVSLIRGL
jgi:Holliday junction resolvase